jgi:hypothetical protein
MTTSLIPSGFTELPDNNTHTHRFEIKSETSDRVYKMARSRSNNKWQCNCPGWIFQKCPPDMRKPCKHLRALAPLLAQIDNGEKKEVKQIEEKQPVKKIDKPTEKKPAEKPMKIEQLSSIIFHAPVKHLEMIEKRISLIYQVVAKLGSDELEETVREQCEKIQQEIINLKGMI